LKAELFIHIQAKPLEAEPLSASAVNQDCACIPVEVFFTFTSRKSLIEPVVI
jgi:hypothetical protein